jgi:hypothetical protein
LTKPILSLSSPARENVACPSLPLGKLDVEADCRRGRRPGRPIATRPAAGTGRHLSLTVSPISAANRRRFSLCASDSSSRHQRDASQLLTDQKDDRLTAARRIVQRASASARRAQCRLWDQCPEKRRLPASHSKLASLPMPAPGHCPCSNGSKKFAPYLTLPQVRLARKL